MRLGYYSSSSSRIHGELLCVPVTMYFLDSVAESLHHHAAIFKPLVLPVGVEVASNHAEDTIFVHME